MGLRSSVDRALVSGTKGRRFESCRGHDYGWVVLLQPSFLRFTTPKVRVQGCFPREILLVETEPYHLIEIHPTNLTHLMQKICRITPH